MADGQTSWLDRVWGALGDKRGPRVWVHASSVGEVMAATPILKAYRERRPDEIPAQQPAHST